VISAIIHDAISLPRHASLDTGVSPFPRIDLIILLNDGRSLPFSLIFDTS